MLGQLGGVLGLTIPLNSTILMSYYEGFSCSELAERYCLLGTPDECVEQLKAFEEAGAQDILLSWLAPADRISGQIEVAGREILPRL